MECKEIRSLLPAYEAGTLDSETARQVANHLLVCPICAGALEQSRADACCAPVIRPGGLPRTTPPEKKQDPAPAEEPPATPPAAPPQAEAEPARPKKKSRLSRRHKLLLALTPLVILGAVLALLLSRDVFSIRARMRTADGAWTAVLYQGAEAGSDSGFRIRLWTDGDWDSETAFYGMEYTEMEWSPDGRYLAVAFLEEGLSRIYIIDSLQQENYDMKQHLERYLTAHDNYMGDVPLTGLPACTLLGWLPDSSGLLVAATGTVDTVVDPNYGIELAAGADTAAGEIFSINLGDPTVSGYFTYIPQLAAFTNITGFGQQSEDQRLQSLKEIRAEFYSYALSDTGTAMEVYYQSDALIELAKLPDSCQIQGISYQLALEPELKFAQGSWQELRMLLTADSGLILFTDAARAVAYAILVP